MNLETIKDRSRLDAFADGELSPEEAAGLIMHLAENPQDMAYLDRVMAANQLLAEAFSEPMHQPVPDALRRLILTESAGQVSGNREGDQRSEASVLRFPDRAGLRTILTGVLSAGLAAAAVLAVMIVPPDTSGDVTTGPVAADSSLAAALSGLPSGHERLLDGGRHIEILASLPARDGYCREFALHTQESRTDRGLACGRNGRWTIEVLLAAAGFSPHQTDFAPASGPESGEVGFEAINLVLDRQGAGIALPADEEAAIIARNWAD